ncbi:MAG TPA: glycosyltransferase [Sedimentisphaerales bacterium]|jgi:glycosyltransferase involved in cell wall biosynthesis/predicted O-methyltransferase YrrM|nr:glycosyltransferase [Sedimentisphaerales bacterium]HNU27743.1 glycosyltransferase [Sedimentisphaerales bacterium]
MSFLSDTSYRQFLDERIRTLDDATTREHVEKMFELWYQQYRAHRLVERMIELLASETDRPNMLYLRCEADVQLLHMVAQRHRFDARVFRGFLAADDLRDSLRPEWFSPFPLHRAGEWRDSENTVVFTLSSDAPFRNNGRDRGNDYMSRFIDLSRLADGEEIRRRHAGRSIVLYADYRKVQTIAAISQQIRTSTDLVTVLLADAAQGSYAGMFDHVVEQPYYLWPLVFKTLQADIVHVDVGWGTQGLPFMPFVPDARKAVVDFYDVTELVPQDRQEGSLEQRVLARASERHLWANCRHFVHRCFDPVTEQLQQRHEDRDIVSLVEYVKDPVYSHASDAGADLKIVYAGIIIQDAADTGSVYYRRFMDMANSFARDNLHLYIYPSPYLYGFGRPKAVEELIRTHGLANVHACEPLEEDEFVRAISTCDYGMSPPPDSRPCPYPDSLPYKVIAYLRAGLPIVVPEDLTYLAELVRKHDIGVVYRHEDLDHMPEILSRQDVRTQKENVARFRSLWSIARGGEKMAAMYHRILHATAETSRTVVQVPQAAEAPTVALRSPSPPDAALSLEGRTFISQREYAQYLEEAIERAEATMDKEYVRRKVNEWSQIYQVERMRDRAEEKLAELQGKLYALYVDDARSLHVVSLILRGASAERFAGLRGLVIEDDFLATLDVRQLGSYRIVPASRLGEIGTVIFSVSGQIPGGGADCVCNDYLERFIDLRRFDGLHEIRRRFAGHDTVLYPLYREIQTVPIMAQFVRQKDDGLRSVSLSPAPLLNADFDATLVEPFFYLWPLILRIMDPSLVHLNVGWGIQALALSAFLPDRARTVVDFYEVLSFLPDGFFERTHSTARQVRGAEEHFFRNYDHIMHLCSEETSAKLARKYDSRGSIVSVTEYLQEPTYDVPPRNDGEIRLVYGGAMLAVNSPDNFYYRPFLNVVRHYTKENLRLYIYNSPYLDGTGENNGLKEVIREQGLANVFACRPLRLEEFVRTISQYDYGTFLLLARDLKAAEHYNYYMAYKFLAYLRAGLPIVIDADNRYLAGLVEQHRLGVVLGEQDMENLPTILNSQDLVALKRNVVEARERFSIERGGEKVLRMYHEILRKTEDRSACRVPVAKALPSAPDAPPDVDFDEMIDVMARKENRLYYRDQSAHTMASLAGLARQFDPSVIVELGTLGGLSLRTWIASTKATRIYAVDLSFATLRETMEFLPADLSRVTLLEQDILKTDFPRLWTAQDRVIFFVDAHDLPNVPIMTHVLTTALPTLPDGSVVVIDDLWFSEERLTADNARQFLETSVLPGIDELQCFHGHFAPYHEGGSFLGFAEAIPLLKFVNEHGIPLIHDRKGKHAFFVWRQAYLEQHPSPGEGCGPSDGGFGSVLYNPMESVPVRDAHSETMRRVAALYRQRSIQAAAENLSKALSQDPQDPGLSYGLAVCLARGGMLSQARDVLARNLSDSSHPRYRRLSDDLARRAGAPETRPTATPRPPSKACGLTLFAMPKAFVGHTATIQKNAIRSWARLDPRPEILLFGDEPGIREMAQEIGAKHIAEISRSEFGTPLVDKLFAAAQDLASHSVLAYVNADMILMQDFAEGVQKVQAGLADFLLIGQRWDLLVLDEMDFLAPRWRETLVQQVREHAMLHAECGLDYFVFRKGLWPQIPPFAIGRTAWDNWLVMAPQKRGVPVVDGTAFITAVHQEHDYAHVRGGRQEVWNGEEARRNRLLAGEIDDSAYTTGATWALSREGQLYRVQPRPCEVGSLGYRSRRIAWLAKQAEQLMARREWVLAANKWEEALTVLDKLTPVGGPGCATSRFPDDSPVTRSYKAACVSLARCYEELGNPQQAAAGYARLLETPSIEIAQVQSEGFVRERDRLLAGASRDQASSGCLPVHRDDPPVADSCRRPQERSHGQDRRIALIVSIPERSASLRDVLRDIENQVDEIRILLNEFEAAPQDLYGHKKVSTVQTNRTGESFASGVWNLLKPDDEGYVFVVDDDIAYPPDYVERMTSKIEEHQRRAVMVVHGIDFCEPFEDYVRDRTVYRFEVNRSGDGVVDAGGVGTLAFHTSTIRPCLRDFQNPSFRDLWFAVLATRRGVPMICVAREAGWLRARATEGRQLWFQFGNGKWKDLKNEVFRQNLLPLLDRGCREGRARKRDFTIFCFTNGRSTFEYSVRSIMGSQDLQDRVQAMSGMHFLDAAAKCVEICDTPYFFKVDDDFILHPGAIAYVRKRVLEHPQPEKLGIYYCHLWEDWTSRVRESVKVYNVEALRKIGGFKADSRGKVDRTTLARLQEAGFQIVADPSVVALHACGTWEEQLEYERLWSSMAREPYRKPTHEAMKKYCGTRSLDEQYQMRVGFLEQVNRQLKTPFHEFLADGAVLPRTASRTETSASKADGVPVLSSPTPARVQPSPGSRMTIFAMPKPFTGRTAMIQKNAIRSWARLDPTPEILLFGDEPGTREMAEEVGARHIREVGRNEFGTPLVNELFQAAQHHAGHDVLAYVNADIILSEDFVQGAQRVGMRLASFLLVGRRWDLPVLDAIDFGEPSWHDSLMRQLREQAMLHAECGLDYFVFRKGLWPQIPPFAIGRTAWDNWLVMDPNRRGVPVVDGTEFITAVHQDHDYGHVAGGRQTVWGGEEAARNRDLAGPVDHTGLTSGATWILRKDGELTETSLRMPRYNGAEYREKRSVWLLRQARRILDVGAMELAVSYCEETIACLDIWFGLERQGYLSSDPACHMRIAERCVAAHTLLAQCYMQLGRPEQVAATYTRLLEHPAARMPAARRNAIIQIRDRLARRLKVVTARGDLTGGSVRMDTGPGRSPPRDTESPTARPVPSSTGGHFAVHPRPKVTVITTCYNNQRYLKECVDSILSQTMTEWELFLIDDGSTDGTRVLIEDYARRDARIHPCCFPDNRGPYVRRNSAIQRAASDFIVIHDVDDIMAPTKLERLYREINTDGRLAMVGSFIRTFLDEFRGPEYTEAGILPVDSTTIINSCAAWQASISHGAAIIRKALFDTIGLYDENPFAADAFWSAKLALYAQSGAAVKMANIPDYLTLIRIHAGSQTQMLPVFDPRGRRMKYRYYGECRLENIREKRQMQPDLDVAAELRHCDCSDFLTRFKAQILLWESEALPVSFMNDLLKGAVVSLRSEAYVSCVTILSGLEVMQRDIARRVAGFDLLRAMALHASGLPDLGRTYLEREIENHDGSVARRLLRDSQEQGPSMDVYRWYMENVPDLELKLMDGEPERAHLTCV